MWPPANLRFFIEQYADYIAAPAGQALRLEGKEPGPHRIGNEHGVGKSHDTVAGRKQSGSTNQHRHRNQTGASRLDLVAGEGQQMLVHAAGGAEGLADHE